MSGFPRFEPFVEDVPIYIHDTSRPGVRLQVGTATVDGGRFSSVDYDKDIEDAETCGINVLDSSLLMQYFGIFDDLAEKGLSYKVMPRPIVMREATTVRPPPLAAPPLVPPDMGPDDAAALVKKLSAIRVPVIAPHQMIPVPAAVLYGLVNMMGAASVKMDDYDMQAAMAFMKTHEILFHRVGDPNKYSIEVRKRR